jgi:hypothetical protein
MKVTLFMSVALTAVLLSSLSSCTKDENTSQGQLYFELTDAPVDDANIQGVFVTIADVKVDGSSIENFSGKQSVNLMAYQNGQVKALGSGQFDAGSYSNINLVLDYSQDATGTSPGCYVLTKDGVKHALQASASASNSISATGSPIEHDGQSSATAVLDFDLRKAIRYNTSGSGSSYQFVTTGELNSAVRLAAKSKTGTITGTCTDAAGQAGTKIVVHAYKKGTYTAAEKQAQGSSGILFKNAVSSTACDANGNFTLAFIESGDYELHFVGYEDTNNDGKMEVKGMLLLDVIGSLNLSNIAVDAQSNVQVNVTVTGVLPF